MLSGRIGSRVSRLVELTVDLRGCAGLATVGPVFCNATIIARNSGGEQRLLGRHGLGKWCKLSLSWPVAVRVLRRLLLAQSREESRLVMLREEFFGGDALVGELVKLHNF